MLCHKRLRGSRICYSIGMKRGETITIKSPVDVHAHLREPGTNKSETIASGTRAARAGGYQAVFDMPNNPGAPTHSASRVVEKLSIASRTGNLDIGFYAGIDLANPATDQIPRMIGRTVGLKLYMGKTTGNNQPYTLDDAREAIDVWINQADQRGFQAPILLHAEGDIGAETADYIARQDHQAHWCHVSTTEEAHHAHILKQKYPERFTAEVTPHHLTMTDINAEQLGWPGGRMMPSLKTEIDRDALQWAFTHGDIDIIGTDHAPHAMENKLAVENENPHGHTEDGCATCFGVSGIEFAVPILARQALLGNFSKDKSVDESFERLEDALYTQPLRMLGIQQGNMPARTVLELGAYRIEKEQIVGSSENTPYINMIAGAKVLEVTGLRHPRMFMAQQKVV